LDTMPFLAAVLGNTMGAAEDESTHAMTQYGHSILHQ
jgi:hypothetical protein